MQQPDSLRAVWAPGAVGAPASSSAEQQQSQASSIAMAAHRSAEQTLNARWGPRMTAISASRIASLSA